MNKYLIINTSNGEIISKAAYLADKFWLRFKGLLGKRNMRDDEALIIYPCSMVHTLGMKMDIDVLFINDKGEIIYIIEKMLPGNISPMVKKARCVIEMAAGKVANSNIAVGHTLFIGCCD